MKSFRAVDNEDGTWSVRTIIVIYRQKFGKHPDFLQNMQGDAKIGYNTKYCLLIEDDLTKEQAEKRADELYARYDALQSHCENTGDWRDWPFKDAVVCWAK